ncbi:hypothetical protein [Onishia taeanensis]|uniref:hypothetical protein n=1 Tax=Onishia taeanensis TaxID=284577 RepID=UPI00111437FC|nr:hypothetical protein [Halomonas taeanensis]
MEKVEVTWRRALIVWWSYVWRLLVFSMLVIVVIGFLCGFIFKALEADPEVAGVTAGVLGYMAAIFLSVFILKKVLNKKYKTFSVVIVPEKKS